MPSWNDYDSGKIRQPLPDEGWADSCKSTESKTPAIALALGRTDNAVARLDKALSVLLDRLAPIMGKVDQCNGSGATVASAGSSDLASRINGLAATIDLMAGAVTASTSKLEI